MKVINKNYRERNGYHDALQIYWAPKLTTVM